MLFKRLYEDHVLQRITAKLTPELARLFIQRIEIGERAVEYSRNSAQSVKIIYRDTLWMNSSMRSADCSCRAEVYNAQKGCGMFLDDLNRRQSFRR